MATKKTTSPKRTQSPPSEGATAQTTKANSAKTTKGQGPISLSESYDNVQCIGFDIVTAPKDDQYKGIDGDITLDIKKRCDLMFEAIQLAAKNIPGSNNTKVKSKTLKLFMAPEFYFRGPKGAYDLSMVGTVTSYLRDKIKGAEWKDWLFVLGSIITYSKPSATDPYYQLISISTGMPIEEMNETYNYALVQRGGWETDTKDADENSAIVMKEFLSGIDFVEISPDGMDMTNSFYMPVAPPGVGKEVQVKNYDGLSVFNMAGFDIGTEICLDHDAKRLINSPQAPGDNYLQLQLIPSCGMNIIDSSVAVIAGGLIFNVDGLYRERNHGRSILKVNGSGTQISRAFPLDTNVSDIFWYGPGQVSIYDPLKIPSTIKVPGILKTFEYNESPFYLKLDVYYDTKGTVVNAFLSGTVENYGLSLLRERVPIQGASFGKDISLNAKIVQGTFQILGKTYDRAIEMQFSCGNSKVVGAILPFHGTIEVVKKREQMALIGEVGGMPLED